MASDVPSTMSEPTAEPPAAAPSAIEDNINEPHMTMQPGTPRLLSGLGPTQESLSAPEHPSGPDIRRQVEYYFSDENLPNDRHLLEKCQGRLNVPVSIRSICGFSRMRQYKPFLQVVESLKKSAFLDVVEGNKIRRKIPLMGKTILDEDDNESDVDIEPEEVHNQQISLAKKKKQRIVQQPKVEKPIGFDRPHGFEEFFADAPVTPAEFQEEVSMYDPGISFRL